MAKVVGYWDYCPELVPKNIPYTDAHRRATLKYRKKNRDLINERQSQRHGEKMRTDLNYRNMKAKALIKSNAKRREREAQAREDGNIIIKGKLYELKEIIDTDSESE